MPDPCIPAAHSPATLHAWSVWRRAHAWWRPVAIAVGCAAAAAVPVAVFYPYAPQPAIAAPLPPPLPSPGSAGQGFYMPPREGSEFSPYLPPSYVPSGGISPIPTGFFPIPGETPRTAVPEPASIALLVVGAVGAVLVRRRRG